MLESLARIHRTHTRQKLQRAEGGQRVARVVGPAQHGHEVLDVPGLEELQSAELHERDLALGQLDFEDVAVTRAAEQHGLAHERHVGFAAPQDLVADVLRLGLQLVDRHQARPGSLAADRQQMLAVLARRLGHHRVGDVQHRLSRAIVLRQRDDLGSRAEPVRKAQDVLHGGGAERIDRLGVVADHCEPRAVRLQRLENLRLQLVGVLILIHQHVIEMRADMLRQARLGHHDVPVQQQIVVVEQVAALLLLHVCPIQPRQIRFPLRTPRILLLEGVLQRRARVHPVRVDLQTGVLARETLLLGREPQLLAQTVHQIRRVGAVQHAELRIELQVRRVVAQQPVADGVERARPAHALRDGLADTPERFVERFPGDLEGAAAHFGGRAARKGKHQNPRRVHPVNDQMGHAIRERIGLARARAGDDEQRSGLESLLRQRLAVGHGLALRSVESLEV